MEAVLERFLPGPSVAREPRHRGSRGRPEPLGSESSSDIKDPATRPVPDEELLRLYRGGDQQAFRRLYERHRAPLIRFVRRTAFDPAEAEEIIQETWMAVIRGRERYVANARFVTYLFSIARRRGIDRWRRRGRRLESEDAGTLERASAPDGTQPESLLGAEALAAAMAASIQALPPLQREVYFEGLPSDQSAVWVPRRFQFHLPTGCLITSGGTGIPCVQWGRSIASVLRELGARDVVVSSNVATFSVLELVEGTAPADRQVVPARWEKVTLDSSAAPVGSDGPISVQILPLFETRNFTPARGLRDATVEVLRPVSP